MQLDHISTYPTIGILFDIFFVVDQLKLVYYAIYISNCNFKMSGIGNFINCTYWMDESYQKNKKLASTVLTIFWKTKSKITNKHNNLLDTALYDITSNFVSYS